ncbi:MAG TPA: response regulator transcription factor [Candidatus Dormibacteraeota bacterium]|nr:response regulator transcription factor [Candidatus Dormibacteraeota bacterium]
MPTRSRVLLVDDHPIVISGIRRLLAFAPDFEVVGQASNARDAVESAIAAAPDLILLDLHLPDVHSADLCRRLRATVPSAQVVIFTAFVDAAVLRTCLSAGVAGVLLKDAAELDLVGDLRRIRSGRVIIDERVQATADAAAAEPPILEATLTQREHQVLRLLAEGMSGKEMATTLGLAPNTVRSYCQSLLSKLQSSSRIQALAAARARGLL